MKLNQDLVRLLLSAVEASPEPVNLSELTFDGFSTYDVRNHLKELFRRGYISGEVNKYLASTDYIASFLTPAGFPSHILFRFPFDLFLEPSQTSKDRLHLV